MNLAEKSSNWSTVQVQVGSVEDFKENKIDGWRNNGSVFTAKTLGNGFVPVSISVKGNGGFSYQDYKVKLRITADSSTHTQEAVISKNGGSLGWKTGFSHNGCDEFSVKVEITGANPESFTYYVEGKIKNPNPLIGRVPATIVEQEPVKSAAKLPPDPPVIDPVNKKDSGARFTGINGQVEVSFDHGKTWVFAKREMVIHVDDQIRTGEDAEATLGFADMSVFKIRQESIIIMACPPDRNSKVKLVIGNIWINVKKMIRDGSMEIEMEQAVSSIKGTTFELAENGNASVCRVYEGKVNLRQKGNNTRGMDLTPGQTMTVTKDGFLDGDPHGLLPRDSSDGDTSITVDDDSGGELNSPTDNTRLPTGMQNLALNKTTNQVNTDYGGDSRRAVDGNTDGNYFKDSVTHTANAAQAWWEVDLGEINNIDSVRVWNRTDCCGERLTDFCVIISNTPFTVFDVNSTLNQPGVSSFRHQETCKNPSIFHVKRSGRYVRIQLVGANYLSLAEVEVLGTR